MFITYTAVQNVREASADCAFYLATCETGIGAGPSTSVWLVPGTGED